MSELVNIRCMIVDDEPPARLVLSRFIADLPVLQLVAEAGNAVQAWTTLQQTQVDLLFLDIHMPQLNGLDFLRTLKQLPRVVLTTAYPEYALQGYELDVVDYLVKPIPFERFLKAVNKAVDGTPVRQEPTASPPDERAGNGFIYFRVDRKMVKVFLADIRYVESMKDYVKVNTKDGTLITKQSISSVEAMLPEAGFFRIHRSYIVSAAHIRHFSSELIGLSDTELPIGKLYRQAVLKQLASQQLL